MKKFLFVLVAVTGFIFSANAQDIILKKDGSEIKAKVLEITDQQVKYKDFNFQDGPTRNINISEIFMVTYANGQKEVFNKPAETKNNADNKQGKVAQENEKKENQPVLFWPPCVKRLIWGLDFGIGAGTSGMHLLAEHRYFNEVHLYDSERSYPSRLTIDLGSRLTYHFIPFFGADFIKINGTFGVLSKTTTSDEYGSYTQGGGPYFHFQFLSGFRGNTPCFFKCMSGYLALRCGYGIGTTYHKGVNLYRNGDYYTGYSNSSDNFSTNQLISGFCLELETGFNLTPTIFVGFVYNFQHTHRDREKYSDHWNVHNVLSFRAGFNFGKIGEYQRKAPRVRQERTRVVKEVVTEKVVVRDTVTLVKEVYREIPLEIRQTMVELSKTLFAFNEFNLNEKSISELNKVVNWLKQNPGINVEIEGHTDNKGTAEYNQQLSEERAKSVYDYFVKNGISASRLSYKGYGLTRPIADNTTEAGRQQNRRVELRIVTR